MTVAQYRSAIYSDTNIDRIKLPPARVLALLNEGQVDFVDRTLCLKASPSERLTLVDKQTYSISGDKLYLDTASGYKWTASTAVGAVNEYYCQLLTVGDPSLDEPDGVHMDGANLVEGTIGSLADHEWAYGDNDSLTYSTVYIADASGDPDTLESVILLEPGGFGIDDMLRIIYFRYMGSDITDNELDIDEIGIDESTQRVQHWAFWNGTIYLDPVPSSSEDIQLWYIYTPAALTGDSSIPEVETVYHPSLLYYALWKYYDGIGGDKNSAKDNERMYTSSVQWAYERNKIRRRTGSKRTKKVFP